MKQPLRIAWFGGPGNLWRVYRTLACGRPDETTSHVAFSEQFLRVCQKHGAQALVLTTNTAGEHDRFGRVEVRRVRDHFEGKTGLSFQAACVEMALDLRREFKKWRPDVIFVPDDPTRAAALELMRVNGAAVLRAHHCTLWPRLVPPNLRRRVLLAADRPVLKHRVAAILSASAAVSTQIAAVTGGGGAPILEFLPLYRRDLYAGVAAADRSAKVMRVVFVGRIEDDKGVFDLFDAARLLRARSDLAFDICGDGGVLPELTRRVAEARMQDRFVLHGWCDRPKLVGILSRAHIGCAPTSSRFGEGFNQAALEMILAGRPVVTSRAVPAVDYVRRAVHEVRPDDPESLARAFVELVEDRDDWDRLRRACADESAKFFDEATSYGAAFDSVLSDLIEKRPIRPRRIGLDGRLVTTPSAVTHSASPVA